MIPVVIIQTAYTAYAACHKALVKAGLTPGIDFFLVNDELDVSERIIPGEKQMLITGTFRGKEEAVVRFVSEMRSKNSQLVTASFSVYSMSGPFDLNIPKVGGEGLCGELVREVKKFLAERGTLTT